MFAFPGMLVSAARKAGIKVPDDYDNFNSHEFPHFEVFCIAQLGQSMPYPGVHFDNAKIIASIPETEIKTITMESLYSKGFLIG